MNPLSILLNIFVNIKMILSNNTTVIYNGTSYDTEFYLQVAGKTINCHENEPILKHLNFQERQQFWLFAL